MFCYLKVNRRIISLVHDNSDAVRVHSRVAFPQSVSSYPHCLADNFVISVDSSICYDSLDPHSLHRLHFEMDIEDAIFAPSDRKYA